RRLRGRPLPLGGKLAALGVSDGAFPVPPDKVVVDLGDLCTPLDAAHSLVFQHAELLTTQAGAAADLVFWSEVARGIADLRDSISSQAQAHESDPSKPNWVSSEAGTDWKTGQQTNPIYVWSDATLEYLRLPLQDALQHTKNDPDLEH